LDEFAGMIDRFEGPQTFFPTQTTFCFFVHGGTGEEKKARVAGESNPADEFLANRDSFIPSVVESVPHRSRWWFCCFGP
jgi:hypothetical protein